MTPDVIFTLTGPIEANSRALKQLDALDDMGLTVLAFGLGKPGKSIRGQRVTIHTLPRPEGSGPRFFRRVHRRFQAALRTRDARVYHASDLYTLPACAARAQSAGARLVYDARECYTHVASTASRPWVTWFWKRVEGRHIKKADAVFTVSPSIARFLADTYDIEEPAVLYNVPRRQSVAPTDHLREALGIPGDQVVILHQGHMQRDRGCFVLAKAMETVKGAVLVFMGGGPLKQSIQTLVKLFELDSVIRFLDPVPPDELLAYTSSADIGVTLLEDICLNHRYALPNKLFEYVMAGIPILASDLPEIRRVVADFEVGLTVDPAEVESVAAGLQKMVDAPAMRAKWAGNAPEVLETFSWESAYSIFVDTYQKRLLLPA